MLSRLFQKTKLLLASHTFISATLLFVLVSAVSRHNVASAETRVSRVKQKELALQAAGISLCSWIDRIPKDRGFGDSVFEWKWFGLVCL